MTRGESGAALLDAMIALALTAILAAAASGVIRAGLGVVERAKEESSRSVAEFRLSRAVSAAFARIDPIAPERPALAGDARELRWRGVLPGPDGEWRSGIWRIEGDDLALARCPDFISPCKEEDAPWPPQEDPARFAYAGADGIWRETWPAGAAPHSIRLRFDRSEAEIFVSPRISGAAP